MELNNDFEVSAPIDKTWAVLTDVERIAPCLPGAQLQVVDGDEYRGIVKVKVGPITAQYKGAASFVERDDENGATWEVEVTKNGKTVDVRLDAAYKVVVVEGDSEQNDGQDDGQE